MKKCLALLLTAILLLGLAACGGEAPGESGGGSISREKTAFPEATPTPEAAPPPEAAVTPAGGEPVTASFELKSANMCLELPAGWEYTVVGGDYNDGEDQALSADTFGLAFWPAAHPELRLSLLYYINGIGMCGTGVTIEEVSYANGLAGRKYTESYDSGEKTMLTVIFTGLAGTYALDGFVPAALLEEYGGEIDAIIGSAALSQGNLTEAEAVAAAEKACTVEYDNVRASYDFLTGKWIVSFYTMNQAGGGQAVCLDQQGNVVMTEYGE